MHLGISPSRLREELEKWIELHLTNGVSGVLLVLSRAFDMGESRGNEGVIKSLESVLSSLPDNLVSPILCTSQGRILNTFL